MKLPIFNLAGEHKGEIETRIFDSEIRKDIVQRVAESEKRRQPNANFWLAGKQASASGLIKHGRRKWKTAYGKGISRVPRKVFWRRGTQFYWQAATIASARKGRRAHPPKILAMLREIKVNKKEKRIALLSALALTSRIDEIKKKYARLENRKIEMKLPVIIDEKILHLKSKELFEVLEKVLKELYSIAIQDKKVRPGIGKRRGRPYRKSAGLLIVSGNKEKKEIKGIEIVPANILKVSDLASNGARLVLYTEQAIKDLESRMTTKEAKK